MDLPSPPPAYEIRENKKVGKGRAYFQNWSVAWPTPSEDMAKKMPIVFKEAPWQKDSSVRKAKGFAAN